MSKYIPTLEKNNRLKEEFSKQFASLLYKVENGKIHSHLDKESITPLIDSLKKYLVRFNNSVGTGKENVRDISIAAKEALKNLEKSFNQELISQVEVASDELIYIVESWTNVLNGNIEFDADEFVKSKTNWSKKRLVARLDELQSIKEQFILNETRLEKDVLLLEKEKK